jgi:hypothetical protein
LEVAVFDDDVSVLFVFIAPDYFVARDLLVLGLARAAFITLSVPITRARQLSAFEIRPERFRER